MSVYVDDGRWSHRGMKMCHMLADTTAELHAMADRIGVDRRHIEDAGTWREHYNICQAKRRLALAAGALAITQRDAARRRRVRRGHEDRGA